MLLFLVASVLTLTVGPWLNVTMQAAAHAVPAAGESDASVPCCGMNGWRSQWPLPSAQRQKTARAGREARDALHGQVPEAPLTQGSQPAPLSEVAGWQSRVSRHTVDQIVDAVPGLPTLDGPVPILVEQQVYVLQLFDAFIPVAEQDIDVPKIFIERIPPRTSVREPQLAEQLVEAPTIVSYSLLQLTMEQNVDIPVPQGGGRHADLQGFPSRTEFNSADRRADR